MKKSIVLTICLVVASLTQAHAYVFEPEVTNWSDSTENAPGLGFFPLHPGSSSPENIKDGWYAWGTALEFNLDQAMTIHSVESPIAVSRGMIGNQPIFGTWTMNLTIYSGSTNIFRGDILPNGQVIPIANSVFSQNFVAHGHDLIPIGSPQGREYRFQGVKDMDLNLAPGKYWATWFDGSVVTYVKPQVRLDGEVTTPEPATLLLMGGGLAGMFLRRRKVS